MNKEQVEKLGFIILSLKEFCYGLDRLDEISDQVEQSSALMRFYMNSLYEYTARYLLLDKQENVPVGGNLYPALKELSLEDHLTPIIDILNERIGNLDLQNILRIFRNKMITHCNFTLEPLKKIYEIEDLRKPENFIKFQELLQRLYDQIKQLYIELTIIIKQYT